MTHGNNKIPSNNRLYSTIFILVITTLQMFQTNNFDMLNITVKKKASNIIDFKYDSNANGG